VPCTIISPKRQLAEFQRYTAESIAHPYARPSQPFSNPPRLVTQFVQSLSANIPCGRISDLSLHVSFLTWEFTRQPPRRSWNAGPDTTTLMAVTIIPPTVQSPRLFIIDVPSLDGPREHPMAPHRMPQYSLEYSEPTPTQCSGPASARSRDPWPPLHWPHPYATGANFADSD
jgi:hypothetical protein